MARPKAGYFNKAGKRIPGNTTIIGENLGWKTRGLMYWAWSLGMEGKNCRDEQEGEATVGTLIHACIDAEFAGEPWPSLDVPPEDKVKIDSAMLAFYEFRDGSNLEITGSEIVLISEEFQFGTTIDHPARIKGRRAIVEVKSAPGIYADFWIQMAAQGKAWNENFPDDPIAGYYLLRVGKKDAGFSYHFKPSLDPAWQVFWYLRQIHGMQKHIV